jgi:hypothetical protein
MSTLTDNVPDFLTHESNTVSALLIAAFYRCEIGKSEALILARATLPRLDEDTVAAALDLIAEDLDAAQEWEENPRQTADDLDVTIHPGNTLSAYAEAQAAEHRALARFNAEVAASQQITVLAIARVS